MQKVFNSALLLGAAAFMAQIVTNSMFVMPIRFGAFFYFVLFVFAGLWVWKKK
jgi:hypothetical protein